MPTQSTYPTSKRWIIIPGLVALYSSWQLLKNWFSKGQHVLNVARNFQKDLNKKYTEYEFNEKIATLIDPSKYSQDTVEISNRITQEFLHSQIKILTGKSIYESYKRELIKSSQPVTVFAAASCWAFSLYNLHGSRHPNTASPSPLKGPLISMGCGLISAIATRTIFKNLL